MELDHGLRLGAVAVMLQGEDLTGRQWQRHIDGAGTVYVTAPHDHPHVDSPGRDPYPAGAACVSVTRVSWRAGRRRGRGRCGPGARGGATDRRRHGRRSSGSNDFGG
ncbi:hypothetical protein OHB41_41265 [Streptomyces sp. NBC_01571]|uniref:hypothetical protein n=1 Tax=Streptomyces sp. NBC_01571 TaxID=2975883 RepID=UPI0022545CB0|nr:hypothetical protein [Streptomyces sp. NBC_01571]MCX4579505.1 hypothetical protein [Streptomyces sp. NBC_01571]